MAPDLGDLQIFEERLVIHGIKAGGRRLTKALFWQLAKAGTDDPGVVRAWVNIHWKGCGDDYYNYVSSMYIKDDHRHIIWTDDAGRPSRDVWFRPYGQAARVRLLTPAEALSGYALLYGGLPYEKRLVSYPEWRLSFNVHGMAFDMDAYGGYKAPGLNTTPEELFTEFPQLREHWPADQGAAEACLEDAYKRMQDARSEASEMWRFVTTEVPQVFI